MLEKAIKLLNIIKENQNDITLADLVKLSELPKTTVHRILKLLCSYDYVQETKSERYKLGIRMIEFGGSFIKQNEIVESSISELKVLTNNVKESSFLACLSGPNTVYLYKNKSQRSITTSAEIGTVRPLYSTAVGKVFLAFVNNDLKDELLDKQSFEKHTDYTLDKEGLLQQLKQIQKEGVAIEYSETEEGIGCIAAPIFNYEDNIIGAVSVAGPEKRIVSYSDNLKLELRKCAFRISKQLGYYLFKEEENE